ncbi:MAG: MarR family winged helix-turn-helix transcriptional regulator [Acidobacteriaceae bacterium]
MSSARQSHLFPALNRAVRLFIAGSSLYSQRMADQFGLHPTDMQFLNLLELLGPTTPGVLGRCSGLSSGGVTVVLDRLEKAGYVRRSRNPADRRSVLIAVVPARQKKLTAAYATVQEQFRNVLGGFSDQELETVLRFFSAANEARPPAAHEAD